MAINANERIASLLVKGGNRIKQGQLLAKLEIERFELAASRADAQVKTQEQVVARLEAGTRLEEIRKAKADDAEAEASLKDDWPVIFFQRPGFDGYGYGGDHAGLGAVRGARTGAGSI